MIFFSSIKMYKFLSAIFLLGWRTRILRVMKTRTRMDWNRTKTRNRYPDRNETYPNVQEKVEAE
jgi:hypothetical protein